MESHLGNNIHQPFDYERQGLGPGLEWEQMTLPNKHMGSLGLGDHCKLMFDFHRTSPRKQGLEDWVGVAMGQAGL